MQQGTPVIRKSDKQKLRPIYGTIAQVLPDNRVRVAWNTTQQGLVRVGSGHANQTEVNASTLVEVTPAMREEISAASKQRKAAYNKQWEAARPYVCNNVNPLARVAHEGHRTPEHLLSSQVKDGKCHYCGAIVYKKAEQL
ncbi:MAG TPA: hypothetical protein VGN34_29165 [Ktedonobacteraceae bacterium]